MKTKFYCDNCKSDFESEGKKLEYLHPTYGKCWKRVANCPVCNTESNERSQMRKSSSTKNDFDSYVEELRNRGGGCCGGNGCCS